VSEYRGFSVDNLSLILNGFLIGFEIADEIFFSFRDKNQKLNCTFTPSII